MFRRSWVRIPIPYTGWTFLYKKILNYQLSGYNRKVDQTWGTKGATENFETKPDSAPLRSVVGVIKLFWTKSRFPLN